MRRVVQKHTMGCGYATLAMVTGDTYDEVVWHFYGMYPRRVRQLTAGDLCGYVYEKGGWTRTVRDRTALGVPEPRPFAPAHMVLLQGYTGRHWVAMRKDGVVLDPSNYGQTTYVNLGATVMEWVRLLKVIGVFLG